VSPFVTELAKHFAILLAAGVGPSQLEATVCVKISLHQRALSDCLLCFAHHIYMYVTLHL